MEIKGSKILCIGSAGFIGSHLVDQLTKTEAAEIVVFDNFVRGTRANLTDALKDPRVKIFDVGGDVRDVDILNEAMKGKDYVFHLAALWLLQCHDYPRAAFETNIAGTFNVLEACVKNGIKKLVYSSSASVYGDAVEIPMTEAHPFNNKTFYGATKVAGEQMCRAFHVRYGLNYVGLRYMNVYGPRQDDKGVYTNVIAKTLERIENGERPIIYGDGSATYDFVYVEDVARANILALKSDATDRFYNIGRGTPTTVSQLVMTLLGIVGSGLTPEHKPQPQAQTFVTKRVGSIEAALDDIGFYAEATLQEGLRRLTEWRKGQR